MRPTILLAVSAFCLAACDQGPKVLLGGGQWTCAEDEIVLALTFGSGGKLTGDIKMDDESSPEGLHVLVRVSGPWELKGEDELSFSFTEVAIAEAKRGSEPLEQAEAEYFKGMFSDADPVNAKIASIGGNKLVLAQDGKDDLTCTR